ncbi:MAG: FKBP-type peptidyl-prolyl cis-trans isomerase, partial [Phycisphaerales bacterium]|nr:FKBP-type peptidyl-prolyl cis-trans isomerase [Phycisphaerales bacterium]
PSGTQTVLRVLDFAKFTPTHGAMITGIWAAPEMFPAMPIDRLGVNSEIILSKQGDSWAGATTSSPTLAGGAVRFSTEFSLAKGSIVWTDRGFNASNTQVWGLPAGQALTFTTAPSTVKVERRESGLVIMDFVIPPGDAPTADGTEIAVHVNGYLQSDGLQVDNSKAPGREPLRVTLPAQLPFLGINEGVTGVRVGQFRRLIVPAHLAFGERGRPRSNIPANATLVYEIEGLYVQPPAPKAPAAEGAAAPAAPAATTPAPQK